MKVLVTGGVRSGKSRHAEALLVGAGAVTYVAPGPAADDADWADRIAAHQATRPASWTTVETHDLAAALALACDGAVIVDCLGTWLTAVIDERELWDAPSAQVTAVVRELVAEATAALARRSADTVLVTNEVGLGVVPAHRSGRLFRDLLGTVNQELAAACDEVHLVIAGRVLKL
ncbi:bifunctional adenosylcobinamide kinase/adenosylcobinamide-phosphate guanylyltransferase [Nocardioides sp. Iso805N]|uniref:bifunctional adenosylcobinamide kinase/adenosylcobinamide-phosphate guanylyltransferase n=1 Tax=Nocardioides sp. Iso805N TaxID=1283287 RepID=UPI000372267E|nr:bifunctional adenosylcobinamide kinase/adenosylcobinamide-phosphate guanylyltransferase [Nocardioides sp. Iso805N]